MSVQPIKIEVSPQEAEKFVRAMAIAGKDTTTNEIAPEVFDYRFHERRVLRYEARIDYGNASASITIHVPKE